MADQLDLLTCFAGASPVKTLAPRGAVQGSMAHARGCGSICSDSCARCGPLGSLLRTSLLCELVAPMRCSAIWKRQSTPRGRSWWVLMISAPRTGANGRGSSRATWPTATAGDAKASGSRITQHSAAHPGISLTDAAVHGLTIEDRAARWMTPTARDWKDSAGQACSQSTHVHCDLLPRQVFAGLQDAERISTNGKQPASLPLLNADWVLQLMGYPRDWARLSTRRD